MRVAVARPRRGLERFLALLSAFALMMTMLAVFAPPALAHHPMLDVEAACIEGKIHVYWYLSNGNWSGRTMTVDEVGYTDGADKLTNIKLGLQLGPNAGTSDHLVYDITETGTKTLSVRGDWSGGGPQNVTSTTSVDLAKVSREGCYPAEIIVEKAVTPGSDETQAFEFDATGFILDDNTLAHNEKGSSGALWDFEADYSVAEKLPLLAGWEFLTGECTSTDPLDDSIPADINLSSGETVTCTFLNHEIAKAQIIVKKVVTPGSDETQAFDFESVGFTLDDDTLAHNEVGKSSEIIDFEGPFSVSESTVPEGWRFVGAECTSTDPEDESTPDDINLSEGEVVTCTFTNEELGRIIIEKEIVNAPLDEVFSFEGDAPLGSFQLGNGGTKSASVAPGSYDVSEVLTSAQIDDNWRLVVLVCDEDGPQDSTTAGDTATAVVQPGETVHCKFGNTAPFRAPDPGRIIVKKVVSDGDVTVAFNFTASYDTDGFVLTHGGTPNDSGPLAPGKYAVAEVLTAAQIAAGWDLSVVAPPVCIEDGVQDSTTTADAASVVLQSGETVTCTFTNEQAEVQASVVVDVTGVCLVDANNQGYGELDVVISGDSGSTATVVIKDGSTTVATLTSSGKVKVDEGKTYTWTATPGPDFVLAPGSEGGTLEVSTCTPLPYTGIEVDPLATAMVILLGTGLAVLNLARRREEG